VKHSGIVNKFNKTTFIEWCLNNYYIDRELMGFSTHKFMIDLYATSDESRHDVIKKSAQCGATELMMALSFYFAAVLDGVVLYLFPTKTHVGDFVQQRVDPAIQASPVLSALVKGTNKVGLKEIGNGFIYYRGMNSEKDLISVPADLIIVDEFDQCNTENLPLAIERLYDSPFQFQRYISTPIHSDGPIDMEFKSSDRRFWFVRCDHCGDHQNMGWLTHVVREHKGIDIENSSFLPYWPRDNRFSEDLIHALASPQWEQAIESMPFDLAPICQNCQMPFNRLSDGEWVAEYPERSKRGWQVTRLFSPKKTLAAMFHDFIDAQQSTVKLATFFRMGLGQAFDVAGEGLSRSILEALVKDYSPEDYWETTDYVTTAGIDVGSLFNIQISRRIDGKRVVFFKAAVKNKESVTEILTRFNVDIAVIDVMPETRIAKEIRDTMPGGVVYLANFGKNCEGQAKDEKDWLEIDHAVCKLKCDRTMAFDESIQSIININPRCVFPAAFMRDENWVNQMSAPKRQIVTNDVGKTRAVWIEEAGRPDHYRLADVYDFLAERVLINREGEIFLPKTCTDNTYSEAKKILEMPVDRRYDSVDMEILSKLKGAKVEYGGAEEKVTEYP
jgi:hypothetical protein